VHEDDRGPLLTWFQILRQKQLVVNLDAVRRLRQNQLRHDFRVCRECAQRRVDIRRRATDAATRPTPNGRLASPPSTTTWAPDANAADRFNRLSFGDRFGPAAAGRHSPDMAALDVAGVRRVKQDRPSDDSALCSTAPSPGVNIVGVSAVVSGRTRRYTSGPTPAARPRRSHDPRPPKQLH